MYVAESSTVKVSDMYMLICWLVKIIVPSHTMEYIGQEEVKLHSFLTSELGRSKCSGPSLDHFMPKGKEFLFFFGGGGLLGKILKYKLFCAVSNIHSNRKSHIMYFPCALHCYSFQTSRVWWASDCSPRRNGKSDPSSTSVSLQWLWTWNHGLWFAWHSPQPSEVCGHLQR